MIVIAGLVLGAVLGARTALKRGGKRLDALRENGKVVAGGWR